MFVLSASEFVDRGWGVYVLLMAHATAIEPMTSHPNTAVTRRYAGCWLKRLLFARMILLLGR